MRCILQKIGGWEMWHEKDGPTLCHGPMPFTFDRAEFIKSLRDFEAEILKMANAPIMIPKVAK